SPVPTFSLHAPTAAHLPVPSGIPRAQAAGGFSGPAGPSGRHDLLSVSIRRRSSTTYCIRQATTPKPERWERAHLTNGPLHRVARRCHRSLPPALFARDSPRRLQFPSLQARPIPGRSGPGRPSASVRVGPVRPPAQLTTSRLLSFFCHGTTSAPSGTS